MQTITLRQANNRYLWFGTKKKIFACSNGVSLVAQMVKNPPAMQETQVQSLVREDLLEKGMATHSSILA